MTRNETHRPRAAILLFSRAVTARCGLAFAAALAFAATAPAQSTSIGLSTVRAQRFVNAGLGPFVPQQTDYFAWALAVGDFDGNGSDELATGIPFDDGELGSEVVDGGAGVVRFGSPGEGLGAEASVYHGEFDPPEAGDGFGYSLVACDFDGNGSDDLAVGAPYWEAIASEEGAGRVFVHYHGSSGAIIANDIFTQNTAGVPNSSEANDNFGLSLACGNFDGDGYDDLAIGSPGETLGTATSAGMLFVIPGSPDGLDPNFTRAIDQNTPGIPGIPEASDVFSLALAAGDFDGDGRDDLAIGVLGEDGFAGVVQVVFGSPSGLDPLRNVLLGENVIGGLSEPNDWFGYSLIAGDFDGDGRDDLAIGIPGEDFVNSGGNTTDNGQVAVVYGAPGGFDLGRTQWWAENNILGPGTSETGDLFGYALASGDFDRDGRDDLAMGHPGEVITGPDDGAATVLMGSAAGLSAARRRTIAAGLGGFPGDASQHHRLFGFSLAAGDFDGDGHADLALGAPAEDDNGLADVGAEMVLYGSLFADGFESGSTALWSGAAP